MNSARKSFNMVKKKTYKQKTPLLSQAKTKFSLFHPPNKRREISIILSKLFIENGEISCDHVTEFLGNI